MTYKDLIKEPLNKELGAKYKKQCDEKLKKAYLANESRTGFHIGGMAVSVVYALLTHYIDSGYNVKLGISNLEFEFYDKVFLDNHYNNIVRVNTNIKNI